MAEKESLQSVRRALRILKALKGRTLDGIANSELASALHESPSNVTRSLQALIDEGLVQKLENGRFAHSTQMLQIAVAYADHIARTEDRIRELKQRVSAGSKD